MKKIYVSILALVLCGMVGNLSAQSKTAIKLNPLSLFVATINVQAEHSFAEKMSIQLGGFYGGFSLGAGGSGAGDVSGKVKYNWYGVTPEFRYYVYTPEEAPEGFYVGPFFRYQGFNATYTASYIDPATSTSGSGEVSAKLTAIGGGVLLGYQFIFGDHFAWDIYLGPAFYTGDVKTEASFDDSYQYNEASLIGSFNGPTVRFGTSIGVAF